MKGYIGEYIHIYINTGLYRGYVEVIQGNYRTMEKKMATTIQGLGFRYITRIMENQMEKDMETGIMMGNLGCRYIYVYRRSDDRKKRRGTAAGSSSAKFANA